MTAIQNLIVEGLRQIMANGVSFTVMLGFCGWLIYHNKEQKQDCGLAIAKVQTEVDALKNKMDSCDKDRLELSVKVAAMEAILDKKKNK